MPYLHMYNMIRVHCRNLVTVNVKCLHVLYDSYDPHTLYGIGILWSSFTLYGTGIVCPPTCEVSSCLI